MEPPPAAWTSAAAAVASEKPEAEPASPVSGRPIPFPPPAPQQQQPPPPQPQPRPQPRPQSQYSLQLPPPGSIPPPPSFGGPPTGTFHAVGFDPGSAPQEAKPLPPPPTPPAPPEVRAPPETTGSMEIEVEVAARPSRSRLPLIGLLVLVIAGLMAGAWALLGARPADPASQAAGPAPLPAQAQAPAPAEPKPAVEPQPVAAEPKPEVTAPAAVAPAPPAPVVPTPAPGPPRQPDRAPPPDPAMQAERAQRLVASAEKKYEKGDFSGAVAEYRRSLGVKATPPGFVGLGRALYDSNQTAEAVKALEAAQKLDLGYAPCWLLLGEIHQGEGRVAPARAAYQRFLQLQPNGEQARAVREILARQLN